MPFTISHAAAVLPLRSLAGARLPLAALMVGSLSPDFAYFLPPGLGYSDSHSLPGVFRFCLPVSLLAWLFFVTVLERPTLAFLPDAWRRRIAPTSRLSPRNVLVAAVAVVLGAFTHLAWDAFTHAATPVTDRFPVFHTPLFEFAGLTVRVYFALQVLSSVFGLVVLAVWALNLRKLPATPQAVPALEPPVSNLHRWLALAMVGVMSIGVGLLTALRYDGLRIDGALFVSLIGAMTGAALGWILAAIALRLRSRGRTSRDRPAARISR
jgi:hypothetical protein